MKTKCCNYEIDPARPVVMWNEFNGVAQCHNCGQVYEPSLPMILKSQTGTPRTDELEMAQGVRLDATPDRELVDVVQRIAQELYDHARQLEKELYRTIEVTGWAQEKHEALLRQVNSMFGANDLGIELKEEIERALKPFALGNPSATWPIVFWFAEQMEKKLADESPLAGGPEGWRPCSPLTLLNWLRQAVVDLNNAMDLTPPVDPSVFPEIIKSAANVANYAMMIADQANEAMRATQQKETEGDQP